LREGRLPAELAAEAGLIWKVRRDLRRLHFHITSPAPGQEGNFRSGRTFVNSASRAPWRPPGRLGFFCPGGRPGRAAPARAPPNQQVLAIEATATESSSRAATSWGPKSEPPGRPGLGQACLGNIFSANLRCS
jgi:hypothetical protein